MVMRQQGSLVAVVVVLVGACPAPPPVVLDDRPVGDGEGEDREDDDDVLDLPALQTRFDEVRCAIFACQERAATTEVVCAAAAREPRAPYNSLAIAAAHVEAGRAQLDPAAAAVCAAAIDGVALTTNACIGPDADEWQEAMEILIQSCGPALYDGIVPEGGACDDDTVCADGGVCPRERQPDCVGSCVQLLTVGASCVDRFDDCHPTAFCDGSVCVARPQKPLGEFCVDPIECQSGKCFDFACRDASPRDGECIVDEDCQRGFGLYCRPLPPSTGRQGVCALPARTGETCGFGVRCVGNQPCAGHARRFSGGTTDGVCQATVGAIGDPCVPLPAGFDVVDSGCSAELRCDPSTSRCIAAPAIGAPCVDGACGGFSFCDSEGVCRAQRYPGETASGRNECRFGVDGGFSAATGTCFDPEAVGPCGS
jgi:hypothetical protein